MTLDTAFSGSHGPAVRERLSMGSGDKVVHYLQYEVREGREAGEVVVLPKAFLANCNGSFILRLDEEGLQ